MRLIVRPAAVTAGLALALAACQPQAPDGGAAAPPADAPTPAAEGTAFSGLIRAVGTEPFWGLQIEADELILIQMDDGRTTAPNPGPDLSEGQAVWRSTDSKGAPFTVTLRAQPCSDGMSDLEYPYEAQVEAAGRTLSGCAAKADAMPREGG